MLVWPAEGVSPARASAAAGALVAAVRESREGALDPVGVAAVVGAEQLRGLAADGLAGDVERLVGWLSQGPHGAGPDLAAPDVHEEVVLTAREALEQVIVGLIQVARGRGTDAGIVNVEAGHHAVVTDGALLRAAVRAGRRSLADMPYYEQRYGRRGRRFTSSDSAWLVTLVELSGEAATAQVTWLARVLAERGMPAMLLEAHLLVLADELAAAAGPASRWAGLVSLAEGLAVGRRAVVPDDLIDGADARLVELAGELVVPRAGNLVAAAVADVGSGIALTTEPCTGWLADADRFGEGWATAVRALEAELQAAAGLGASG